MDKERAKFVLQSFRPDGSDVGDVDFAEALKLATIDRELGEWLVKERAFDAEFAECLARVDLPQGLRESILLSMVQSGSDYPKVEKGNDQAMVDGLARVKIPTDLRARILESMERSKVIEIKSHSWMRFGIPAAAVAGIAVALVVLTEKKDQGNNNNQANRNIPKIDDRIVTLPLDKDRITVDAVQASFDGLYKSSDFSLEKQDTNQDALVSYLRKKKLPCGGMEFPPGMENMKGLGCREITVGGKKGSLICFGEKDGILHLIIFRRKDVEGDLPTIENPNICKSGEWTHACWGNEKYAYTLISKTDNNHLKELF